MKKLLFSLLAFLLTVLLVAGVFLATVFIASEINDVTFYNQMVNWFGPGTWIADIFMGW